MLIKIVRLYFINFLFIVCCSCPTFLTAQVKKIIFEASGNEQLPQKFNKTLKLSKGANTQAYLTSVRFKLIKQGYFLASIDSVCEKNDSVR